MSVRHAEGLHLEETGQRQLHPCHAGGRQHLRGDTCACNGDIAWGYVGLCAASAALTQL